MVFVVCACEVVRCVLCVLCFWCVMGCTHVFGKQSEGWVYIGSSALRVEVETCRLCAEALRCALHMLPAPRRVGSAPLGRCVPCVSPKQRVWSCGEVWASICMPAVRCPRVDAAPMGWAVGGGWRAQARWTPPLWGRG